MKRYTLVVKFLLLSFLLFLPIFLPKSAFAAVFVLKSWTNNCDPSGNNIPIPPDPSCQGSVAWSDIILQNTSSTPQTVGISASKFFCDFGDPTTSSCGQNGSVRNYSVTVNGNSFVDIGKLSQATPAGCGSAQTDFVFTDTDGTKNGPFWGLAFAGSNCAGPAPSHAPRPTLVPCGGPCSTSSECVRACPICGPGGTCIAPTASPVPCGGPCSNSSQCVQSCPICGPGNTCVAPSPSPVPCGGPCSNSSQCIQTCPICGPNGTCIAPSPTPVPCGGPCSSSSQCIQTCPICSPGGTCAAAPSCNCDGMDITGTFFSGSTFTVTGHAKVENPTTNPAKVLNMVYSLFNGNNLISSSSQIAADGPVSGTDSFGTPVEKYSSSWSSTIPTTGNYKVVEQINCGWKSSSSSALSNNIAQSSTVAVLDATNNNQPNIVDSIMTILRKIFFSNNQTTQVQPTNTPAIITPTTPPHSNTIQLGVIAPTVVPMCHEVDFYVPL